MTTISPTELVQGDRDRITVTLTDGDGFPYDLTARTVTFRMWSPRHGTVVERSAVVSDALTGEVQIELAPTDTERADQFKVECTMTGTAADPTTVPRGDPLRVTIRENGSSV